jgi:signal transduction histidine kinase
VSVIPKVSPAAKLARQLWITSILCWWLIGIQFSRLWWLVNQEQLRWILFCYAWEVPAIGWTGAVLLPYLRLRRLQRRLAERDPGIGRALARFPVEVAAMVMVTSTIGYFVAALQVSYLAALPALEFAKITVQGPVLGGLFAVAAYLLAERAIQELDLPTPRVAEPGEPHAVQSLYGKIRSIMVALTIGVSVPIFLYGLTQSQLQSEELRAQALEQTLEGIGSHFDLEPSLARFGPRTYGFVVRRSNNQIVWGEGKGTVLFGDGRRDFQAIQTRDRGWFASRDQEHKVVAFQHRPGLLPDGDGAVFVAVSPLSDYGAALSTAARTAAVVAACALIVGVILAAMLARNIVRPIDRVRIAAGQMAGGDLAVEPVAMASDDEVSALARAFDRMAVRVRVDEANLRTAYEQLKQAQAQAVQHERLSAIGRVVSGVAHELNNPLSAVLHLSEELRRDPARSSADQEALETIADQARRCRIIVRDLLSFARGREQRPEPTEVATMLVNARAASEPVLRQTGARLELLPIGSPRTVSVDRAGLEQVLTNLIVNGAQAAGHGGKVTVEARDDPSGWCFVVEDSGPGIPADVLPRIFEPFFTTKPEGHGTGLGLAVSLGIVERHGGTLEVEGGGGGQGARFTVRIPAEDRTRSLPPPRPVAANGTPDRNGAGDGAKPRALVVDDEGAILLALRRYLSRQGWEVDQAEDGEAALQLMESSSPGYYGLVISDIRMPQKSGIEVHDWLVAHRPDLFERLIITTGDVASPAVRGFVARTPRPVIEKPFELTALAEMVERVRNSAE